MRKELSVLCVHASADLYGSDRVLLELIRNLNSDYFNAIVVLPYSGALLDAGAKVVNIKMGVLRRKYLNPFGVIAYSFFPAYSVLRLIALVRKEGRKEGRN